MSPIQNPKLKTYAEIIVRGNQTAARSMPFPLLPALDAPPRGGRCSRRPAGRRSKCAENPEERPARPLRARGQGTRSSVINSNSNVLFNKGSASRRLHSTREESEFYKKSGSYTKEKVRPRKATGSRVPPTSPGHHPTLGQQLPPLPPFSESC